MENKKDVLSKRSGALEKRLEILKEYIEAGRDLSLAKFLAEKGISREDFIAELPNNLKNPPAADMGEIMAYTGAMAAMYAQMCQELGKDMTVIGDPDRLKSGIVDGDYVAQGRFFNGDGMGYIASEEDQPDNWVEAPTYSDISEASLRYAMGNAWKWIAKWEAQREEAVKKLETTFGTTNRTAVMAMIAVLQMKIDNGFAIINWIEKRLDRTMTADQVRAEFDAYHQQVKAEQEAIRAGTKEANPKFFNKVKNTLDEIARVAGQNWRSIVSGLKKSPKEILDDLKKESQKSLDYLKKNINIHNANKYNPVFILARRGMSTLLKLNIFGLAWNFNRMRENGDQQYWNKLVQRWELLGGDKSKFIEYIEEGKNKTPIVYKIKGVVNKNADGDGNAVKITAAVGTLTAATPIIANAIKAGTIPADVQGAMIAAGGAIAAMAPIMVAFGKSKGENVSGPDTGGEPGPNEMPDGSGGGDGNGDDDTELSTTAKWIIGGAIGASLLVIGAVLLFGGKSKG